MPDPLYNSVTEDESLKLEGRPVSWKSYSYFISSGGIFDVGDSFRVTMLGWPFIYTPWNWISQGDNHLVNNKDNKRTMFQGTQILAPTLGAKHR